MFLTIGMLFLISGFFGARWFYEVLNEKRVANNVLETMVASFLIIMGIIGVNIVFAALRS